MDAAAGRGNVELDETTPCLAAAGSIGGGRRDCPKLIARSALPLGKTVTVEPGSRVCAAAGVTLVLVANALERTAFFALTTSLVYFLTKAPLCWSDRQAAAADLAFACTSFAACVLGGLLADCAASRFGAAAVGYVLYAAAYAPLVVLGHATGGLDDTEVPEGNASVAACERSPLAVAANASIAALCGSNEPVCGTWLIATICTIMTAQALVHANLATLGADQVRRHGLGATRCCFSMLFWSSNVGTLAAAAGLSYVQIRVDGLLENSLISLICLLLSAVVFGAGFKCYVRHQPNRYAIKKFLKILPDAVRLKKLASSRHWPNGCPNSLLDYAKVYYGGRHHDKAVEEVKTVGRMLIVWALLISYSMGIFELVFSFQIQGLHMKAFGSASAPTPPSILFVFYSLSILLTLPFLNNVAYPFLGRCGYRMTLHIRISAGILLAALSFLVAGCNESFRLKSLASGIVEQRIGHTIYDAAPMSMLYQIPQYILLGISEAFVGVAALEYTYLCAPKAMRSIMIGLLLGLLSFGPLFTNALHQLYASAFGWSSINVGHVDYELYTLAGLQLLGSCAFYAIGRWCKLGLDRSTIVTRRRLPMQLLND